MDFSQKAPMQLGFIGGAHNSAVGYTHFNASRLDGHFQIKAGCFSRNPEHNAHSGKIYGVPPKKVYPTWQGLLEQERSNLDGVVVLTPTPSHVDIVIAALEAGLPVICEKSLGVSSEECQRIDDIVKRQNGFLAVTFNYSGYHMVRELRRRIIEGKLGELQQIHIEMPQEAYLRQGVQPQKWRCKDYTVPTVSLDLGVHVHHLVDFLTGGMKPVQVVGDKSCYGHLANITDNVYCLARYQNDIRVQAWWGKTALGYRNGLRVRVFGSKASAEWYQMEPENLHWADDNGHQFILDRGCSEAETAGLLRYNRFKAGHPSGFIEAFANLYTDIAESLLSYKEGKQLNSSFVYSSDHAAEGLRFLEAIDLSSKKYCHVNLSS